MVTLKSELDRVDLKVLIRYAVHDDERERALEVLDRLRSSQTAVTVLRSYYTTLPEGREEMAVDIKVAARKQGTSLIVLQSTGHHYLYLCSREEAVYLGELDEGIDDRQILDFFEFNSAEDFRRRTAAGAALPSLQPPGENGAVVTCVACGVGVGENHILGCPVEQCPWCEGQLSRCNCRFDQLGVTLIEDEELLDRFEELLDCKGRIRFSADENPSYPTAGDDPAPGEIKRRN